MDKLFDQGALDIFMTPIFMKKNRPAYKLSVLAKSKDIEDIEYLIFKETSTIGIRKYQVERTIMEREIITAATKFGDIRLKRSSFKDIIKYIPEYEDVRELADKHNISFREIYNEAMKAVRS